MYARKTDGYRSWTYGKLDDINGMGAGIQKEPSIFGTWG